MNRGIRGLSRRYQAELGSYLRKGSRGPLRRAERLGREAVSGGVETLELARIHAHALLNLIPANCSVPERDKIVKRADSFFLDALFPIEKTHRAMVENVALLKRSNELLRRRTIELGTANRLLRKEIAHRRAAEQSLRLSEHRHLALLKEAHQMQRQLRHLSHQVLFAQEEERKQISRELHDEIAQALTGINVLLASLKPEFRVSKRRFSEHVARTQRFVERSVEVVHRFARDLRPPLLDDLGLIPALHSYLNGLAKRTGLRVGFSTFAGIEELSNDKQIVLYRVAQAALVNIAQHAQASSVSVVIKSLPRAVLMEIRDDGRSFDVERVLDPARYKRLGLLGMRERVEMMGGSFKVVSAPGRGTTVSAKIPFRRQNKG
jgi:signal transduction histidine kinase